MIKRYLQWVKKQWEIYYSKKPKIIKPKDIDEKEQMPQNNITDNGCLELCCGCCIFLVLIYLIGSAIIWSWHIHWLFGLLLLLFIFFIL